jgi:hypothetical protein
MASITYSIVGTAIWGEDTENIEGTFIYDPDTRVQSSVNITLTGPAPYGGVYADNSSGTNNGQTIVAPLEALPAVSFMFEAPLTNAIAKLLAVAWFNSSTRVDAASVKGTAAPAQ